MYNVILQVYFLSVAFGRGGRLPALHIEDNICVTLFGVPAADKVSASDTSKTFTVTFLEGHSHFICPGCPQLKHVFDCEARPAFTE